MKTKKEIKLEWEVVSNSFTGLKENNYILKGNGFYVSYNPDTGRSKIGAMFDDVLNMFRAILGEPLGGGEETALVKDDKFYILNGDFRKEYEKLISKGFDACYKFYLKKKKKYGSSFSTEEI